jgi:probable DNA repair protein
MLSRQALFSRLAQGQAAGIAVVTPNTRLARALLHEFDSFQEKKGLKAWEAADIVPLGAFLERLYDEALLGGGAAGLPPLLAASQQELLWKEIIAASQPGEKILAAAETAAACAEAWRLVHEWRLGAAEGNEDALAFSAWAESYRKKTAGRTDHARLPDVLLKHLKDVRKPASLIAYAFDILPPQTEDFFKHCSAHGVEVERCAPERLNAKACRASYASAKEELDAAARWARARLEGIRGQSPNSIGVVVPDLALRRREVVRVFTRVLGARAAFNVSFGEPLSEYPLVDAALTVLEISHAEIDFQTASRLIRSPFIGGAERELGARARLDARIRRDAPARLSLAKLVALAAPCPLLRLHLEKLFSVKHPDGVGPQDWARHFSRVLDAAGFPGERVLDSTEFQARAKWHEVLGEFARLEGVSPRMNFPAAVSILGNLCRSTLFQPESGAAPIQVLGVLESAGVRFEHLWVSGLTDEAWPLKARPNPFMPVALQRRAGIPQASAEGSLALDRRITEGWLGAAPEVVLSQPRLEKDRGLAPSPLILEVPEAAPEIADYPKYRDLIFQEARIESVEDTKGPILESKVVRGGTRVLADQAACPFRAFARHRLGAEELEAPAEGLDAKQRGSLLHLLMKHLWGSLKDSSALQGDTGPALAHAAAQAVKELGIEGRFAELERARLERLGREWLELESARAPFEVVAIEERQHLSVAGLELSGRIDRLDRLASGGYALIDYKTGKPSPRSWDAPRPDEPQLPVYAVTSQREITAVAFAKLQPGGMRFMGYSRDKDALPRLYEAKKPPWRLMLAGWKREAESLATSFAAGAAGVDPKRGLQTCRLCALQTLCRVHEKLGAGAGEEGE